jgi:hypothetical protein
MYLIVHTSASKISHTRNGYVSCSGLPSQKNLNLELLGLIKTQLAHSESTVVAHSESTVVAHSESIVVAPIILSIVWGVHAISSPDVYSATRSLWNPAE